MSLEQLVDTTRTDKCHSYLPLYQSLLGGKKESARVLEVGIGAGGSIKLWSDFFSNATVYGVDILPLDAMWEGIKNNPSIQLLTSSNAYDQNFFTTHFLEPGIKLDVVLDDGPHTLESMRQFIMLYSQIMAEDGILIIEDVQSWDWIDLLKLAVPQHLQAYIQVYDLRANKNPHDIVFTIDKFNLH